MDAGESTLSLSLSAMPDFVDCPRKALRTWRIGWQWEGGSVGENKVGGTGVDIKNKKCILY